MIHNHTILLYNQCIYNIKQKSLANCFYSIQDHFIIYNIYNVYLYITFVSIHHEHFTFSFLLNVMNIYIFILIFKVIFIIKVCIIECIN